MVPGAPWAAHAQCGPGGGRGVSIVQFIVLGLGLMTSNQAAALFQAH